jgi:hypothetical protein
MNDSIYRDPNKIKTLEYRNEAYHPHTTTNPKARKPPLVMHSGIIQM